MDLFGIGLQELLFILIIILLVARPKDIAGTARNIGRALNRLYKSPNYQVIRRASQEIRNLPARLAREAQLEDLKELEELKLAQQDLQEAAKTIGESAKPFQAWVQDLQPGSGAPPAARPPARRADVPRTANGPRPASRPAGERASPPSSPPASPPAEQPPDLPANSPASPPVDRPADPPATLPASPPSASPAGQPSELEAEPGARPADGSANETGTQQV